MLTTNNWLVGLVVLSAIAGGGEWYQYTTVADHLILFENSRRDNDGH